MIAGSVADTLYFSQDAIKNAKEPKELFIVDGQTHVGLNPMNWQLGCATVHLLPRILHTPAQP